MIHAVIPDVQAKPEQDFGFLRAVGEYLVDKKPDRIICLGDFADLPSLSAYDVGKKSFEGRRYNDDLAAAHDAMQALLGPLDEFNEQAARNKKRKYYPDLLMFLGNHEHRIERVVENDPKLEGTISIDQLGYNDWKVFPYQHVEIVDGIAYSHYFTTGVMGRPVTSARALVIKKHMSCIQGHNQKMEIYNEYRADGSLITGLFAGCATSTTKTISDHKVTTTSEESTCSMMSIKEHFIHIPSHWIISLSDLTKDEIEELWYEFNSN